VSGLFSPGKCLTPALLVIFACAPQIEIVKLYEDRSVNDGPYEKILVVGIATDVDERRRLETLLTENLNAGNNEAVAAYKMRGLTPTVLQDDIDSAASEAGADAILVTHIVSVDKQVEFEEGRTEVLFECRGGDPADYFLYDQKVLKLPDSVLIAHTVVAVTSLYDAASNARAWTIQSTCFDKESMDQVLQEEARAIVRQLKIDDLIN